MSFGKTSRRQATIQARPQDEHLSGDTAALQAEDDEDAALLRKLALAREQADGPLHEQTILAELLGPTRRTSGASPLIARIHCIPQLLTWMRSSTPCSVVLPLP